MKLKWPFKDYTKEEIMSSYGDERNRKLIANDSRTMDNLLFISFAIMTVILIIGLLIVGYNYIFLMYNSLI